MSFVHTILKGALYSKNELLGMDLAGHLFDESMTGIF